MPQAWQAPPAVLHAVTEGVVQVGPEQQPLGHVVLVQLAQTPALQMLPAQVWHVAPPEPQALGELPVSHVVPAALQQPAHVWGSQTHW